MSDFDPSLVDIRRKLVPAEDCIDSSRLVEDSHTETLTEYEGDGNLTKGYDTTSFRPISEYNPEELILLSESLATSGLNFLEIEGVKGLNWEAILTHEKCVLDELRVVIKSPSALADLSEHMCRNSSLSILDLDYYHLDNESQSEDLGEEEERHSENDKSSSKISQNTIKSSLSLNEIFFQSLMPLKHVTLRGISPIRPSSSTLFDDLGWATTCSWEHLTVEDCDLAEGNSKWIPPCIANLEEIIIINCELSETTIEVLSEAYLTLSVSRSRNSSRSSNRENYRKNPLRVLKLINNDWLPHPNIGNGEVEKESFSNLPGDENDVLDDNYRNERLNLSPASCTKELASWLDSLSNLVELDLSNNPQLFRDGIGHGNRGMNDLCGTVNQSLKRFSVRDCQLIPTDLHQIVTTFCWLEALDLSQNPALITHVSHLSQLEYLTELVLENMIEYETKESFEFERRLSDEEFDWVTEGHGLTELLLELLSGESDGFSDNCCRNSGSRRHRRKPLERLNLSGNIMDKRTLHVLSLFESLEVLILMGCQISGEGMIELMSGVNNCKQKCSSLKELYLGSNIIGDIGVLSLAQTMKDERLPLLRVLNLESNVISTEAFCVLVEDGLMHSNFIQYVQLPSDGAITRNQQNLWRKMEQKMEHNLLLNQAGRFALFLDGSYHVNDEENEEFFVSHNFGDKENRRLSKNKIPTNLWPLILKNADSIYGTDALFYFLHKRPDLFFSSQDLQAQDLYHSTPPKSFPKASSPNAVEDIASFLL